MHSTHHYSLTLTWTGNKGTGTNSVSSYERSHTIAMANKPEMQLTTDNAKFGDKTKHNPEDLLVMALSSCHMMSFLYVCALEKIVVTDYVDTATGTMVEDLKDGGHFTEVILNPVFSVTEASMVDRAIELHHKAHEICFIANSVNFPVITKAVCTVKSQ